MDSLVGYGSDDENETERYGGHHYSGSGGGTGGARRRDDDTNYDDVNMDMSEDSQAESEPELPQAEPHPPKHSYDGRRGSDDSRDRERDRDRNRDRERDHKRRESPPSRRTDRSERRSPRKDDRHRSEKDRGDRGRGYESSSSGGSSRRGLLGDRPDDRMPDKQPPALMDLKPFGDAPPGYSKERNSQDARDAVSPRFVDRTSDRRDRERDRGRGSRDRDRDRGSRDRSRSRSHSRRRSEERHSRGARGAAFPPPTTTSSSSERRSSPTSGDYRPSSYKVNRKLDVMEKMGLQIKTPDGSMATAQQLRTAGRGGGGGGPHLSTGAPSYFSANTSSNKIMDQVQKRKMLWSNKSKDEAAEAAKWSGTRFAQDNDGKQVSKFMRLMGIKEPAAVKPEPVDQAADPIKKQEELFQAMQAQYEVARATTHTMRGVGLGFQRGQY